MIQRITLIEPKNDHLHIYSQLRAARAWEEILLATIMKDARLPGRGPVHGQPIAIQARTWQTDLVGISTITPTAQERLRAGRYVPRPRDPRRLRRSPRELPPGRGAGARGLLHRRAKARRASPCSWRRSNRERALSEVPGLVWKENGVIRAQPAGPPGRRPRLPPLSRLLPSGHGRPHEDGHPGSGQGDHPHADLPRLPIRLHVLLRDGHVRQALPAPLDGRTSSRSFPSTTFRRAHHLLL